MDHTARDRANNTPADIAQYFANQRMVDLLADWAARDLAHGGNSVLSAIPSVASGASVSGFTLPSLDDDSSVGSPSPQRRRKEKKLQAHGWKAGTCELPGGGGSPH